MTMGNLLTRGVKMVQYNLLPADYRAEVEAALKQGAAIGRYVEQQRAAIERLTARLGPDDPKLTELRYKWQAVEGYLEAWDWAVEVAARDAQADGYAINIENRTATMNGPIFIIAGIVAVFAIVAAYLGQEAISSYRAYQSTRAMYETYAAANKLDLIAPGLGKPNDAPWSSMVGKIGMVAVVGGLAYLFLTQRNTRGKRAA